MSAAILTLNAGSSSLKFALFQTNGSKLALSVRGEIEAMDVDGRRSHVAGG